WSVIILNVWRGFPFSAVILLAALTAVPQEVIEAAKIDGAGPLRRFHYVVVPIIRPILFVGLLYSIVFSFTDFSAVWLLTQGGPYNTTHVFGTYAYNIGINAADIGRGSPITLFIFPFLAVIVILMLRVLRRECRPWGARPGDASGATTGRTCPCRPTSSWCSSPSTG